MNALNFFLLVTTAGGLAYFFTIKKSMQAAISPRPVSARPSHNASYVAIWSILPALLVTLIALTASDQQLQEDFLTEQVSALIFAVVSVAGFLWGWKRLQNGINARKSVERFIQAILLGCSAIAILVTIGIVLSILFETIRFFQLYSIWDFLFGLHWSPQTSIREGQVGGSGEFGIIPVFSGTIVISMIAILFAGPIGFLSAIFLAEFSGRTVRKLAKPTLEILAGIPTVVYGFFAALWVAPAIKDAAAFFGVEAASENALAAGMVMGVMLIPFVCSLSDDVISAVPRSLRDSSYALGATEDETIRKVLLPAALPGIIGSLLLAISRAIGETMIVLMAAGLAAKISANPLDAMTTVTVQITSLLVGDQEFDSAKTLAAFALGATLFFSTLLLNITALMIVKRYREIYD